MSVPIRRFFALSTLLWAATASRAACAQQAATPDAEPAAAVDCGQALERARALRVDGKLKAASELSITCSQPTCPSSVAEQCTSLYSEVQRILPTVTLAVREGEQQFTAVKVTMDGQPFADELDGRAVAIDPGAHEFTFEVAGKAPLRVRFLIAAGERNKALIAEFPSAVSRHSRRSPERSSEPFRQPSPVARSTPAGVYVLGGVGIAGLIAGTTLRLLADSSFRDLEENCAPGCTDRQTDPVKARYVGSALSFSVGAAALVGAGVMYLVHRNRSGSVPETGIALQPTAQGSGMLGSWAGRF